MNHFFYVVSSIAINTFRGFTRNKIFYAVLLFSLSIVLFSYAISTLTLVESHKILLDFSLAATSISGILISIFLGTISIAREIETRVIYTVISKPISRIEYVIGKYLGCALVLVIAQLIISLFVMGILSLVIDKGLPDGLWGAFYLMILESLLILALSLLASLSSSSALAASITILFFLVGRNAYIFKQISNKTEGDVSHYLFRVLYDALPNLDRFNVREVVAYYKPYASEVLWFGSMYAAAYILFFISIAIILFWRKDFN